jgi:hypothetical protein
MSIFDMFFVVLLGGIMFVLLNRYYKDKYRLVMETNKTAFDLQNKIIKSYKEIANGISFSGDDENILPTKDDLMSDISRSDDESISDDQLDSVSPTICKLFVFIYECDKLHNFLEKIHLYKKIECSSDAGKLLEAYKTEKKINDVQNILIDNIFPILKLFSETKDKKGKYNMLKLQINNLFEIYNNAFGEISKRIEGMDSRVEVIMKELSVKTGNPL